jgi:hypothetical protein
MAKKKKNSFFAKRSLGIAVQAIMLRARWPQGKVTFHGNTLEWEGTLKPSPMSCSYQVRVRYVLGKRPAVTVLSPKLMARPDEKLPHVFAGDELCLYRYGNEWNPEKLISDTTIPWIAVWLLHYEIWLVTGKWPGSKAFHPPSKVE